MSYFNEEDKSTFLYNKNSEVLYNKLSEICLENLMLSSDAYVCAVKMNLKGYKVLHRHLSKKFQDLYLKVQQDTMKRFDKLMYGAEEYAHYNYKSLRQHLTEWNIKLEKYLVDVGQIIRGIFEQDGYISCVAQEVQKTLYKNLLMNKKNIKILDELNWNESEIRNLDKELYNKMKHVY